jgi:Zn-dependent protease with chaperone function
METYRCSTCQSEWPTNYCPVCARTIERAAGASAPVPQPIAAAEPASAPASRSAMDLLRASRTSAAEPTLSIPRWPTERPLFALVVTASVFLWLGLIISIFGVAYALLIAAGFFLAQVALVAYVRGNAVRLGPNQLPELYARVVHLASRAGIDPAPEAYVMQAGGELNAFATRFLRSRMIILFSELLDACANDETARDMVIGHELGHIRAGHLNWPWLVTPGMLVPFLGNAYSRAREYTCDRYGAVLCGDGAGALRGLAVLAAGGRLGPRVNVQQLATQRTSLDTGWMTIGKWLSTHPPLCDRVAALSPALAGAPGASMRGPIRALLIMFATFVLPVLLISAIAIAAILRTERSRRAKAAEPYSQTLP